MLNAQFIAAERKLYLPHGDKKHSPVTTEDIARVVVGILINPESHLGKTYSVTGQKAMSQSEIAEIIGNVLGKPVEYVDIPLEHWQKSAADAGLPAFLIEHLSRVAQDYQKGLFDGVTDVVLKVGGRPPQSFEDFVRENIAAFGSGVADGHQHN